MRESESIIVANWKMNGDRALCAALVALIPATPAVLVLCPPATLLSHLAGLINSKGLGICLGGQDCHEAAAGAYTGDLSASLLKEAGASYVILGHSERRQAHGETSDQVRAKAQAALAAGLTPIICVGETLAQRESGQAEAVVAEQLRQSLPATIHHPPSTIHYLIAYEPVWAIGSGLTPSVSDIAGMHRHIGQILQKQVGRGLPVLYGGSVKAENAQEILTIDGVSGVLVGGASVKAEEFVKIVEYGV